MSFSLSVALAALLSKRYGGSRVRATVGEQKLVRAVVGEQNCVQAKSKIAYDPRAKMCMSPEQKCARAQSKNA